ncbi:helix-hairpin-helix domain-containing protein [Ruegeria sediminis]|uniref:Helix-hairpin-helix domain-containing protein n=1 Tax=Ruegeria sediminis TaxID=2583820 RepID=A0ABY2WUV5_9RHOB|nr:helix-hairpin-helix domain-containing protein [Ruegeria sediminis]
MKPVTDVRGVGKALGEVLIAHGYKTAADLAGATPEQLVKVPRIGTARAPVLIAAAKELLAAPAPATSPVRRTSARKPAGRKTAGGRKAAERRTTPQTVKRAASAPKPVEDGPDAEALAAAEAKAKKEAKAKAKAKKAAKKKQEIEAKFKKAKEKVKTKSKKDKKDKKKKKNKKNKKKAKE